MSTTTTTASPAKSLAVQGLIQNVQGVPLFGELVCWSCHGVKVSYHKIVQALREADLDPDVARRLLPRNAFRRACKELGQSRVIREIKELSNNTELVFQFTSEKKEDKKFAYELECLVSINRETGAVACSNEEVKQHAQALLNQAIETRTGSDVTRIIQRLFEQNADLFPVRDRGGIYFCPIAFSSFVDKVHKFMGLMNGTLDRWPIPAGLSSSKVSVKDSITQGVTSMIEEHLRAIEAFDDSTRADTYERHEANILNTAFKIEAYKALLEEKAEELEEALREARALLHSKMAGELSWASEETKETPRTPEQEEVQVEVEPTHVYEMPDAFPNYPEDEPEVQDFPPEVSNSPLEALNSTPEVPTVVDRSTVPAVKCEATQTVSVADDPFAWLSQ